MTPGFISEASTPKVFETIKALSRINSISSRDFKTIAPILKADIFIYEAAFYLDFGKV